MTSTWSDFFRAGTLSNKRMEALAIRLGDAVEKGGRGSWRGYFETSAMRKAAYRFVEHALLDLPTLLSGAFEHCGEVVRAQPDQTILNLQDTTSLDFSTLRNTSGLGSLESSLAYGLMLHFGLVVTEHDVPLGLSAVHVYARDPAVKKKAASRRQRDFDDKESARWWTTTIAAEEHLAAPGRVLHVSDRESFIYEYLTRACEASYRVLVRAKGLHGVDDEHHRLLQELRPGWIDADVRTVQVPARPAKDGHPARSARTARVRVRFGSFVLKEPHSGRGRTALWGVSVVEEVPVDAQGIEPLDWLLVTNDAITEASQAHQAVDRYLVRWTIEEFNKGLKSGAKAESLQLESREAIERALSLQMLATLRLLQLMKGSRERPETPVEECTGLAEEAEYLHLQAKTRGGRVPVPAAPTLAWLVLEIAKLGGHSGAKSEGPPGWLVLWRGWRRLQDEMRGYRLAMEAMKRPRSDARKFRG